jgi:hypothetical protein
MNDGTRVVTLRQLRDRSVESLAPRTAREIFLQHYDALRRGLHAHPEIGVLLAVCSDDGVLATDWIATRPHETAVSILGRHSQAPLRVPETFGEISLRHLAILARSESIDEVRLRILDLSTGIGFKDEEGHPLRAVTIEGSAFLRVGPLWLLALITGPAGPSEGSAEEAYDSIPERIFITEDSRVRTRRPRLHAAPMESKFRDGAGLSHTTVTAASPPVGSADILMEAHENPMGRLVAIGGEPRRSLARSVGADALGRGILIGRYDRCQLVPHVGSSLSRVHMLLIRDGSDVLAIDTASTNGVHHDDEQHFVLKLTHGDELHLPTEVVLRWEQA